MNYTQTFLKILLDDSLKEAQEARSTHGPHPSREFGACRVAEEAGELVQALTSVTRDRAAWDELQRYDQVVKEAKQTIAMVLRSVEEFWLQADGGKNDDC